MTQLMKQFWKDEAGVTAIEYGLIAALIAMMIVVALTASGVALQGLWEDIQAALEGAT